jgi:hypothetical protein
MSIGEDFVLGASLAFSISVFLYLFLRSGQSSPEDLQRSGYEQALIDITRNMMAGEKSGWENAELRKVFESFVEPQYKSKMIDCPYNLPWLRPSNYGKSKPQKTQYL